MVDGEGEEGGIDAVIVDRVEDFEGVVVGSKGIVQMPSLTWVHTSVLWELVGGIGFTPIVAAVVLNFFIFAVGPGASFAGGLRVDNAREVAEGAIQAAEIPSNLRVGKYWVCRIC
jgi:hypothetical protein